MDILGWFYDSTYETTEEQEITISADNKLYYYNKSQKEKSNANKTKKPANLPKK